MDCGSFGELIGEYLDQGLTSGQRRDFRHHLLGCLPCRQLFDEIRDNILLCREMAPTRAGYRASAWAEPADRPVVEHLPPVHRERNDSVPTIGDLLSCRTLDLLISDFFDAGGAEASRQSDHTAIDRHLVACDNCRVLFTGLREALVAEPETHQPLDYQAAPESDLELRILARTVGASS
jgi:predicted anti-sigma-YlaC factor YlaD